MSKAGCAIALVVALVVLAVCYYSIAPSLIAWDEFTSACAPECDGTRSVRQFTSIFPVILFGLLAVGVLFIARSREPDEDNPKDREN